MKQQIKQEQEDLNKNLSPIVISKWNNKYNCYELIKVLYINKEILK